MPIAGALVVIVALAAEPPVRYGMATIGINGNTETSLVGVPLGVCMGGAWRDRGLGVDGRIDLAAGVFGMGWIADGSGDSDVSGEDTIPAVTRMTATGRFGRPWRRSTWVHAIVPAGFGIHPFVRHGPGDASRPMATAYFNLGVGLGILREFGRRGIFGFDVFAVGGVRLGRAHDRMILGQLRGGGELLFHVGGRF